MFDRSRADWYPTHTHNGVTFSSEQVMNSNGTLRPPLAVVDTFVVHFIGAGYGQHRRPTADVLEGIERWHAIPNGKPNEYNSASDVNGATWEYAGRFRAAHAANHNATSWGHLVVLGLDVPNEMEADGFIRGIRRARTQLVAHGALTRDHRTVPHSALTSTGCPGVLHSRQDWWQRIVAPLPSTIPTPEEPDMLVIDWRPGQPEWTAMRWDGLHLAWIFDGHADAVLRRVGAKRETVTDTELDSIIRSSRTVTPCPPPFTGARRELWNRVAA